MAKTDDLAQLLRVGSGTPLGTMLRRYWHPVALSTQVEADGEPLRMKLLGERLVIFRDSAGKVGVLEEMCMHRGVSLALGRNEDGGLRCLYHGWKFAVDGAILETPNHADCRFRQRMKAPAFPVREQSGLIWTYIGPADKQPPFREFEFDRVPEENREVFRANTKSNWLPLWEGGLDSSHVAVLHTNMMRPAWDGRTKDEAAEPAEFWESLAPTYDFEDTEYGYRYCAFRSIAGEPERLHARMVPAIMPYMRIIPGATNSGLQNYAIEVPMDDFETATFIIAYSHTQPIDRGAWIKMLGFDSEFYDPKTCDVSLGQDNRFGQVRSRMDRDWTGIQGLEMEDFAMSISLGEDWDRSKEHLVTADAGVVRMRRMVLAAVRAVEEGGDPPAVNTADMTGVIAYDQLIGSDQSWKELEIDTSQMNASGSLFYRKVTESERKGDPVT